MTAFNKRMPAGIPGAITRPWESTVEPNLITGPANASNAPQNYGSAVVIDASTGKMRLPVASDTKIDGFMPRPFPGGAAQFSSSLGVTPIDYDHVGDLLRRGYLSCLLGGATAAAKGGAVHVRKANAASGKPIGGVEAAADLGTTAGVVTGTGNGTWAADGTAPVATTAIEGVYTAKFLTTTSIQLLDPNGLEVGSPVAIVATTGQTATINNQIKGVITQGSATFAAGDTIAITVSFNTLKLGVRSYFMGPAYTDGTYGAMTEVAFNV